MKIKKETVIAILEKYEVEYEQGKDDPDACCFAVSGDNYNSVATDIVQLLENEKKKGK